MKIKIGPYKKFFGVFQLASALVFWNEDLAYRLGRKLADTKLQTFSSGLTPNEPEQSKSKSITMMFGTWMLLWD